MDDVATHLRLCLDAGDQPNEDNIGDFSFHFAMGYLMTRGVGVGFGLFIGRCRAGWREGVGVSRGRWKMGAGLCVGTRFDPVSGAGVTWGTGLEGVPP